MRLNNENRIIPKGSLIERTANSSSKCITIYRIYELTKDYDPKKDEPEDIEFITNDGSSNGKRFHADCFKLYKLNDVELDNIFII
jgi:hypothetical protein